MRLPRRLRARPHVVWRVETTCGVVEAVLPRRWPRRGCLTRRNDAQRGAQRPSLVEPSSATIPNAWSMHEVCGLRQDVSERRCSQFEDRRGSTFVEHKLLERFSHRRARSKQRYTTRWHLTTVAGRELASLQSLAFAGHKKGAQQITGCKAKTQHAVAAINNHDARRDDDATYRKTRKNSIRLRAPTLRTEVSLASRERVQSRS